MQRSTIFEAIKSKYEDCLDPLVLDVNILHENNLVYLEVIKSAGRNDLVVYKHALKDWDQGPVYTAVAAGVNDTQDRGVPEAEYGHLLVPLFCTENELEVSTGQFVDLFLMEKEMLMNMTDLFISNDKAIGIEIG